VRLFLVVQYLTPNTGPSQATLLQDKIVNELARGYSATPAQVVLAWGLSRGYSVIPKSVTAGAFIRSAKLATGSIIAPFFL
jgi:diketogulonate reductase-like aldo/keto reductase